MSATDELRRLLDERGVVWGNVRRDGSASKYLTEWQFDGNQGGAVATEWAVGSGLSMEIRRYHLTPEQAIAATLGDSDATRARQLDAIDEILWTLNAEVTNDNIKYDTYLELHDMVGELGNLIESCAEPIAATLGTGTCHNASKVMDEHGQARFACSECGAWIDSRMLWNPEYRNGESPWVSDCKLNYCPNCGRRVVTDG